MDPIEKQKTDSLIAGIDLQLSSFITWEIQLC